MRSAPIPDITRKNSLALTFPTCVETGLTHYIGVAENKISQRAPQPTVRHDLQPRGEKCGLGNPRAAWLSAATNPKDRQERERSSFCLYRDDVRRVCDFHALRHTFISGLAAGGVHPSVAQKFARYSTVTLTLDKYTHVLQGELTDALCALPDLGSPGAPGTAKRLRATGTYGNPAEKSVSKVCHTSIRNRVKPSGILTRETDAAKIENTNNSATEPRFSMGNDTYEAQAAVGFEPTNNGFAIRPLDPLGYAAGVFDPGRRLPLRGAAKR